MSRDKLRFALIGCGRIAYRHVEAIRANPHAEIAAVCDLEPNRARILADPCGVPAYRDYRQMLSRETIDVVSILTPSGMHAEHALEIVTRYRKHTLIEKPFCLFVPDGERLIQEARTARVHVFVAHQNRCNRAVSMLKQSIDTGRLGRIALATVRLRWSRGRDYYRRDPWRGTWALDGGVLTNQAIHHIDILRWLCGEVESVSAVTATRLVDIEVEDTACAWVRFAHGGLGIIEATTAVRPLNCDLEASISLIAEHGTAIVEGPAVNRLAVWTLDHAIDKDACSENPPNVYGFGHNAIIDNIVEVILHNGRPLVSGEDALASVRLLSALYRSAELGGREVFLKDRPISAKLGVFDESSTHLANLYRTHIVLDDRASC